MSVHCDLCGKRVSSLASLSGHYRRKHPQRAAARSDAMHALPTGQNTATGPEPQQRASEGPRGYLGTHGAPVADPPASGAGEPDVSGWAIWGWLLLLAFLAVALFAQGGDSGGEHGDSRLASSYRPEGDGQ